MSIVNDILAGRELDAVAIIAEAEAAGAEHAKHDGMEGRSRYPIALGHLEGNVVFIIGEYNRMVRERREREAMAAAVVADNGDPGQDVDPEPFEQE